jgi:hypothetical protein
MNDLKISSPVENVISAFSEELSNLKLLNADKQVTVVDSLGETVLTLKPIGGQLIELGYEGKKRYIHPTQFDLAILLK